MKRVEVKLNTPEKAVVYARYSSSGQQEQSIEGQLAAAKEYAAKKGYTIIDEYIDRAMTGRNDNRPAFQQMLSDCAKRRFSVIIVWKVDRFGRNREEVVFNKHHAKKYGVRVEYVAESIPDGPESVIIESLFEAMADYFSKQLGQNVKRGLRESAKQHHVLNKAPLGYKRDADKCFEIDPATAPIVKRIFSEYLAGKRVTDIYQQLNAEGLKTSRGQAFNTNSIQRILHNEKYIGIYDYHDGEIRDENAIPAIIDRETFDAVQERLKTNKYLHAHKIGRAEETEYLLTGKAFCGSCGAPLLGESGRGKSGRVYNYYLCQLHKKGDCKAHAIRKDLLENAVFDKLFSLLDDETLEEIAEAAFEYYSKEQGKTDKKDVIQARLKENEHELNNILDAIGKRGFSAALNDRLTKLEAQKAELEDALSAAEIENSLKLTKDHILFFLTQFRNGDPDAPDVRKGLIETFLNSVYVYEDGRIEINVNCTEEEKTVTLEDMEDEEAPGPEDPGGGQCSDSNSSGTFFVGIADHQNMTI